MEILKNLATLACFMLATLALLQISYAQNSAQDFVNAHNSARAADGVGNIAWSTTLATYAQNYANQRIADCALVHSGGPYGENIAWGSGTSLTGTGAVQLWVNEKTYYTYSTNTCAPGKVCGHYTQVVWANSVSLGCARVQCNNNAGVFIICSYSAPGNVSGQKPY